MQPHFSAKPLHRLGSRLARPLGYGLGWLLQRRRDDRHRSRLDRLIHLRLRAGECLRQLLPEQDNLQWTAPLGRNLRRDLRRRCYDNNRPERHGTCRFPSVHRGRDLMEDRRHLRDGHHLQQRYSLRDALGDGRRRLLGILRIRHIGHHRGEHPLSGHSRHGDRRNLFSRSHRPQ